jgi:DNA-binding protein WhiA
MGDDNIAYKSINPTVVLGNCCKRAYIRGSFIAGGHISDPEKSYHLEFTYPPPDGLFLAEGLCALLRSFELKPKITARKYHTAVYMKESESIVDILNIMEAHKCLLQFENARVIKDMRNSVNRKVNFETANLGKTINAAVEQIEDIRYIAGRVGLSYLPKPLEEAARIRLQHESATLKEIGGYFSVPVGKSGVNHRLRKISKIAEALRRDEEAIDS